MRKASLFKNIEKKEIEIYNQTWNNEPLNWSLTENSIDLSNYSNSNPNWTTSLGGIKQSSWVNSSNTQTPTANESLDSERSEITNLKKLPGTTEYFGVLDIVSILWQKPELTLQDSKWNYFAYYWNHLDFVQTVQTLGGNVYEMVTENEILQNQLFGDRVSYINLSTFKDIRVLMVIEIDGDIRLLQVPADKYHYSKDYLKSLFIQ